MSYLSKMLSKLTSNYNKDPSGNIGKLFNVVSDQMDDLKTTFENIKLYRDIDNAEGETLDRIGKNIQQMRGSTTDNIYRVLLKVKVKRNLSDGSIETLIEILSTLLSIERSDVKITELWPEEPAAIQIDVPVSSLSNIGISFDQLAQIINLVVAGGVRANVLFRGTFSFSSSIDSNETDANTGFADINQTTGGTLGAYYDPENSTPLPL